MKQEIDIAFGIEPLSLRSSLAPHYVEICPGDFTQYKFVVFPSDKSHNRAPCDCPVVAVASVEGPAFFGVWLSIPTIRKWWECWKDKDRVKSLDSFEIREVILEQARKTIRSCTNPWTVRAAFLAVLKLLGEI